MENAAFLPSLRLQEFCEVPPDKIGVEMTPLLATLLQIAIEKGIPAVVTLLLGWKEDRLPTPDEIRARAAALPAPKEF